MINCKCYGEDCIFIYKCRKVITIFDWLSLCDLMTETLKEEYEKRIPSKTKAAIVITLKLEIASKVLESFCKKINHPHPELLIEDLHSLYPQSYKTANLMRFQIKNFIKKRSITRKELIR